MKHLLKQLDCLGSIHSLTNTHPGNQFMQLKKLLKDEIKLSFKYFENPSSLDSRISFFFFASHPAIDIKFAGPAQIS